MPNAGLPSHAHPQCQHHHTTTYLVCTGLSPHPQRDRDRVPRNSVPAILKGRRKVEGGSILWFGLNGGITGKHPEWTGSPSPSHPQRVQPPGVLTWCPKSLPAPSQRPLKPTSARPSTCDNVRKTQMTPSHLLVLSLATRNIYSPFKSFSLPVFSLVFTATLKQSQKRL